MGLPPDYILVLLKLAEASRTYEIDTGVSPVLVGGAATALQTAGAFMSVDFDVVAADDEAFARAVAAAGFVPEDGEGMLRGGYYHPLYPEYAVEQVSGALFDGRSDAKRLLRLVTRDGAAITLPATEDMIADRLAQHAIASASDDSRLLQAQALFTMAKEVDRHYLRYRIVEEGGDPSLIGL